MEQIRRVLYPLGLALIAMGGCAHDRVATVDSPPSAATKPPLSFDIHPGAAWYSYRASWLGVSSDVVESRDSDLSSDHPPDFGFWDEQVATESAALWGTLCNQCHGGHRRIENAAKIAPPDENFGSTRARFFGRERGEREIFKTIAVGTTKDGRTTMPGWQDKLSREQIWGLVRFLEHESRSDDNQLRRE